MQLLRFGLSLTRAQSTASASLDSGAPAARANGPVPAHRRWTPKFLPYSALVSNVTLFRMLGVMPKMPGSTTSAVAFDGACRNT